jgi:hypothetical protein
MRLPKPSNVGGVLWWLVTGGKVALGRSTVLLRDRFDLAKFFFPKNRQCFAWFVTISIKKVENIQHQALIIQKLVATLLNSYSLCCFLAAIESPVFFF